MYINDLPDVAVHSTARLFADDCIVYRPIRNNDDTIILQNDLNKIAEWEFIWQMQFNIDKCFILRVGRPKHKLVHLYTLHDKNLSETDSAKYLGLTITSDLQWNQHINNITNKANSIIGLLRRNLRIPSQTIKTHAYQSLLRPHLEYASTVWEPHTKKNIHKLDMIQRIAARYACNRYHNISSVTEMVGHLGWEPLTTRRRNMRLCIYIISEETSIFAPQRLSFYGALGVAACTVGKVRASTVFMCVCRKNGFVVGVRCQGNRGPPADGATTPLSQRHAWLALPKQ